MTVGHLGTVMLVPSSRRIRGAPSATRPNTGKEEERREIFHSPSLHIR